ncbi:hypothetical protein V6N13_039292 [Hibiscus sabdariffa]|uniref:Uncharacterized protein n=1 Tax=Hibiscus sabdariffa TaxID=183260 RepID=A0ABR2SW97_9ROSI
MSSLCCHHQFDSNNIEGKKAPLHRHKIDQEFYGTKIQRMAFEARKQPLRTESEKSREKKRERNKRQRWPSTPPISIQATKANSSSFSSPVDSDKDLRQPKQLSFTNPKPTEEKREKRKT